MAANLCLGPLRSSASFPQVARAEKLHALPPVVAAEPPSVVAAAPWLVMAAAPPMVAEAAPSRADVTVLARERAMCGCRSHQVAALAGACCASLPAECGAPADEPWAWPRSREGLVRTSLPSTRPPACRRHALPWR